MRRFLVWSFVAGLFMGLLVGCGGGGSDPDLSGRWSGTASSSGVLYTMTLTVGQTGGNVTGVYSLDAGGSGSVSGTFNGSTFSGVLTPSNTNLCPLNAVAVYSENKLQGNAVTFNCTGSVSFNIALSR